MRTRTTHTKLSFYLLSKTSIMDVIHLFYAWFFKLLIFLSLLCTNRLISFFLIEWKVVALKMVTLFPNELCNSKGKRLFLLFNSTKTQINKYKFKKRDGAIENSSHKIINTDKSGLKKKNKLYTQRKITKVLYNRHFRHTYTC